MSKDPYRYFRIEARELIDGLSASLLELEKTGNQDAINRLFRLAHTLKGAARVVRLITIAEQAHSLESLFEPARALKRPITRQEAEAGLRFIDQMRTGLEQLDAPTPANAGSRDEGDSSTMKKARAMRVDSAEAESLIGGILAIGNGVSAAMHELSLLEQSCRSARRLAATLEDAVGPASTSLSEVKRSSKELADRLEHQHRRLHDSISRAERDLLEVRNGAERMRLLPLDPLLAVLERITRDTARELEREVRWEAHGGEIAIDAIVHEVLSEALPHLIRNAVVHGMDSPAKRVGLGKPGEGFVHIRIERSGSQLLITCQDDGRGVDIQAVRAAAIGAGKIPAEQAEQMDDQEIMRLILLGGITTSRSVSAVAGRGVGLDVVRVSIERLGGTIAVESSTGGTTFRLQLPASLSSMPALLVEVDADRIAIPLDCIETTKHITREAIVQSADGDVILIDDIAIPLVSLAALLGRSEVEQSKAPERRPVVILRSAAGRAAISTDRLTGCIFVTISPPPAGILRTAILLGIALESDGRPQLVLDSRTAITVARARRTAPVAPVAVDPPLPILVIDDSLTTRTLEQGIIDAAGYAVDVAISAEDAIARCESRSFSLFIVDVEMPGMNGFDFIAHMRNHPRLGAIPSILVTSLDSAANRARGQEVGAIAYMVKAEFDQERLLSIIRSVIGSP